MNRHVFAPAGILIAAVFSLTSVFAQGTRAAPQTTPAPPAQAKWVKPYKGTGTIEVIQSPSKQVGKEIVTILKIRNTSPGALALLKGAETWFDKKLKPVTGDAPPPIRRPINPGEIVELTFRSPIAPDLYRSTYQFTHANGEVRAKQVKEFK